MAGFLTNLLAAELHPERTLQPRLTSRFEASEAGQPAVVEIQESSGEVVPAPPAARQPAPPDRQGEAGRPLSDAVLPRPEPQAPVPVRLPENAPPAQARALPLAPSPQVSPSPPVPVRRADSLNPDFPTPDSPASGQRIRWGGAVQGESRPAPPLSLPGDLSVRAAPSTVAVSPTVAPVAAVRHIQEVQTLTRETLRELVSVPALPHLRPVTTPPLLAAGPPAARPEVQTVHVTIGRIEVRAAQPTTARAPASREKSRGGITLDEYLKGRRST